MYNVQMHVVPNRIGKGTRYRYTYVTSVTDVVAYMSDVGAAIQDMEDQGFNVRAVRVVPTIDPWTQYQQKYARYERGAERLIAEQTPDDAVDD